MANYEIRIKQAAKASGPAAPRPANYSNWPCPFCKGKGLNPYGKTGADRCPACRGQAAWEADAVISTLHACGHCAASGRVNLRGDWAPCPQCKGAGKV